MVCLEIGQSELLSEINLRIEPGSENVYVFPYKEIHKSLNSLRGPGLQGGPGLRVARS